METTFDTQEYFDKMNAWWRAANYLSVGQIYLKDNPLLRRPIEEKRSESQSDWSLGHHCWSEFYLHPLESCHQ